MKKVRLSSNCIVLLERSKSRRERDSRTSTIPLFAGWLVYFSFFSTDYTLFFDGVLVSGWYCTILRTSCGSCTGQGCRCNNICSDFFYYSYIPFFGWIYYQTSISFWGFLAHIYEVFSSLHLQTCQSESASLQLLFSLHMKIGLCRLDTTLTAMDSVYMHVLIIDLKWVSWRWLLCLSMRR